MQCNLSLIGSIFALANCFEKSTTGTMECNHSALKTLFMRLFLKLHQLFVIIIHNLFRIANYGKKERVPRINDLILLNSACSLAAKIRKQKVKSVDVIQAYLSRIQEVNPYINATCALRMKEALDEAQKVDKFIEAGRKTEAEMERETPFLGVPFTSKEIINIAGMPITGGAVSRQGMVADKDAEVVQLMRSAGAIPIAVTNISEYAMWPESHNKVYGRTSNPYDTCRTCGGSSGGEGALISAAGSVIGLGNDIGGSIRIPSCMNGIFGHRPTIGSVPSDDSVLFFNPKLCCINTSGPMCRYATDLLPMMKVLAGHNIDLLKLNKPVHLDKLKVYYIDDPSNVKFTTKTHPEVKAAVRKAVNHFEHAYKIKSQKLDLRYIQNAIQILNAKVSEKGGVQIERAMSSKVDAPVNYIWELILWTIGLSKHVFYILVVGILDNLVKAADHTAGLIAYDDTLRMFQEILDENSVFIFPTWPEPAPHHNELLFKPFDTGVYTFYFSTFQFPITNCPMGLSKEGLPIGIQVMANRHNDRLTMAVAVELEKAFGGWVCPCPTPD